MKELKFSKKSWHYYLAKFGGLSGETLCGYVASVAWGVILCIALAILGAFIASIIGEMVGWIAAMIIMQTWINPGELAVFGVLIILFVSVMLIGLLIGWWFTNKMVFEDSFIVNAYSSVKNKTCVKIKFDE